MTRINGDMKNVDNLFCEISGHEGLFSGKLLMEPPNVKFWKGKFNYYTLNGPKELSIDVGEGISNGSDIPMRLQVYGYDCVGYFTGQFCLNVLQEEFIPAGNGEWIGESDSGMVRITGTWILNKSKNESQFKRGCIRSDDSCQEGSWKGNLIWRGKVENCTESAIVVCKIKKWNWNI